MDGAVGTVERESAFAVTGCPSTAAVLTTVLHIDAFEATARVRAAQALGPRHAITGEPLETGVPAGGGGASGGHDLRPAREGHHPVRPAPAVPDPG